MTQQQQAAEERLRPETSRGHYMLELFGITAFFVLALFMGGGYIQGNGELRLPVASAGSRSGVLGG